MRGTKLLSSSFQTAALFPSISLWHMLTSPKCLSLEKSHHIVIYTEIVLNRMTNEFKGNRDMHKDDVNTLYFFLFGSTSEIVGDPFSMVGAK
jgi:hypothetical protein